MGTVFGRLPEGNASGNGTFLGVRGYETQPSNVKSFALEHSFYGQINSSINFHRGGGMTGGFMTFNTDTNIERMRITTDGKVSIGTTTPGTFRLAVAGKIAANEEVRVFIARTTVFPDYVFDPAYELPKLEETERYIKENRHLPEVPSAADVEKNGMSLNDMNIILLKKVEELTLYMIEMKKENKELRERVEKIENKK